MDGFSVASLLVWYVVFLFSTTFHEFSHSIFAYWGGDPTAYEGGQVTLDPLPHMKREPFGLVLWPILSFVISGGGYMFGWASAPIDPRWARRHPRRAALMSLAGPFSNFLLALLAFVLIRVLVGADVLALSPSLPSGRLDEVVLTPTGEGHGPSAALAMALSILFSLNIILGVFNLLPVPPLDGAHTLEGLFPRSLGSLYERIRGNPGLGFLSFIVVFKLGGYLVYPVLFVAMNAL